MKTRLRGIRRKHLFIGAGAGAAATVLFLSGWVFLIVSTLPSPALIENRRVVQSTKIFDRTGTVLLYEIHGEEKRTIILFDEMPQTVKQATVAIEDAGFYSHDALELKSVLRAFLTNLLRGRIVQGGSTITQQLAKKAFLTDERTVSRKLKELILAFQLERRFSKDEILAAYLNQIPYGSNAYGIEAASQTFFSKPARDLTLAQAATLASLPKAPSFYSPYGSHVEDLINRQRYALDQMAASGFITAEDRDGALNEKLVFTKPFTGIKAPHFVIAVQEYLSERYGEDFIQTQGLKVITTLDFELQQLAERVVAEGAQRNEELYKGNNAALVAQDARTGQILALVGSRNYFDVEREGNFNVATQGLRQPGSSIKPFVYAAAFEKGYTPETIVFDLQTEFDTTGDPKKSYIPNNYDEKFRGPVSLRQALAQSINIPAVKVLYLVGLSDALKTARAFGLSTLTEISRYGLSLVLGGGEVRLIDMVNGYAAFAQDGIAHKQSLVVSVSLGDKVLASYRDKQTRVIGAQYARTINDILSDTETRAPLFGASMNLTTLPDREIALKTGTTNDYRDAWAIGYSPSLTVGVWAGNNDNTPMQRKGGSILAAVPIWHAFIAEAFKNKPVETFIKPDTAEVDKPVLKGNYVVDYQFQDQHYPQIHTILNYIDRNDPRGAEPLQPEKDPQFSNWEKPVIAWVAGNVPNPETFNKELPAGSIVVSQDIIALSPKLSVDITAPASGEFITASSAVEARVVSQTAIQKIEFLVNGVVADTITSGLGASFTYKKPLLNIPLKLQNIFSVTALDQDGTAAKQEVIAFLKP